MYADLSESVAQTPDEDFETYQTGKRLWYYLDFEDRRKSWPQSWRCLYVKPIADTDDQILLEFERPESIIYSNLGLENAVTRSILEQEG